MTLADVGELVGDDINFWLNNVFMTPDMIAGKVLWWITRAQAAAREEAATRIGVLEAAIQAVRDLHVKVENPRHGCCAPPKLCQGHPPECRSDQHYLGGVPWPCGTLRALDRALAADIRKEGDRG